MANAYKLTEIAVDLILAHIKSNIASALVDVAADRNDSVVNLTLPQTYLIYESTKSYRLPCVFVIAEDLDFELLEGANHINGMHDIKVACVVEERNERLLSKLAWRYQCALAKLLHFTVLDSSDNKVRIIPKVVRFSYSPVYSHDDQGSQGVFCKEILIELEVEHYEKL